MEHDEQRVRTMAGWIGVEISRSRVRTEGKAGYGLYRVRGSVGCTWAEARGLNRSQVTEDLHGRRGEWTTYAFTLANILWTVRAAIQEGRPEGPGVLRLMGGPDQMTRPAIEVPTRWTQAYRGRRDLGVWMQRPSLCGRPERHVDECECLVDGKARWIEDEPIPVEVKPEIAALVTAVVSLVGAGLVAMVHVEGCCCDDDRYAAACIQATAPEREVQRAQNAAFQAKHVKEREWGLRQRYAAKLARAQGQHGEQQLGPEIGSQRAE